LGLSPGSPGQFRVVRRRGGDRTLGLPAAEVRYRALPKAHRTDKFEALAKLGLDDAGWSDCPTDWREPFLPAATGEWATYPKLEDFFLDNGSGVMPGTVTQPLSRATAYIPVNSTGAVPVLT